MSNHIDKIKTKCNAELVGGICADENKEHFIEIEYSANFVTVIETTCIGSKSIMFSDDSFKKLKELINK